MDQVGPFSLLSKWSLDQVGPPVLDEGSVVDQLRDRQVGCHYWGRVMVQKRINFLKSSKGVGGHFQSKSRFCTFK